MHSLPRSLLHSRLPKVLKLLVFLHPTENQTTAMIPVCFIILAVIYGLVTNRFGIKTLPAVAAWLGKVGKNNKTFFIPMAFMLCATLTQLVFTIVGKLSAMI